MLQSAQAEVPKCTNSRKPSISELARLLCENSFLAAHPDAAGNEHLGGEASHSLQRSAQPLAFQHVWVSIGARSLRTGGAARGGRTPNTLGKGDSGGLAQRLQNGLNTLDQSTG